MKQVQGFAVSQVLVSVQDLNLRNQSGTLQRKRRARANSSPSPNNRDFHAIG
jgi:hypothetical protein